MPDEVKHAFDVATVGVQVKGEIAPIPARDKPTRVLEPAEDGGIEPLPRPERIDDAAGFARELSRWREWAKPWLADHTPPGATERAALHFGECEFRYEQPEDLADAARRYGDDGPWETVAIPDYRGPMDRWFGYYRRRFAGGEVPAGERVFLCFEAVDYTAEVHLNGHYVGGHTGFFAPFEFDVTDHLRPDGENVLLVRVGNDQISMSNASWRWFGMEGTEPHIIEGNKVYAGTGMGWDDPKNGWTHCPPGAGLWRPVWLEARPRVHVRDLWVRPVPGEDRCDVHVDVWVAERHPAEVSAEVELFPRNFEPDDGDDRDGGEGGDVGNGGAAAGGYRTGVVELREARAETNRYVVPVETPGARRWSPDTPHLYTARVTLRVEGEVVERRDQAFGVRSFTMDEQPDERGLAGALRLNGERIILRGANTMGFLQLDVQRGDDEQLVDDILICRMANMNFLRITQRPIQRRAYEAMDALGLMHQCDLPLFGLMRRGTEAELVKQAGEMERHVRRHPSCIMASIINEPSPYAWSQQRHRTLFRHEMELVFEACRRVILLENPDRVLKATDGDYDPPTAFGLPDHHMYARWHPGHGPWGDRYRGELPPTKVGWRLGCGEYGAEGLDAWETAKACYPEAWLPPGLDPDAQWKPSSIPSSQAVGWSRYWFDPGHSYRTWYDATNTYMAEAIAEMNYAWRRRADRIVSTAVHLAVDAWPSTFLKAMVDTQRRLLQRGGGPNQVHLPRDAGP